MAMQAPVRIVSERTRSLPSITHAPSQTLSLQGGMPRDTVYRALNIRVSGSVTTTFASGTPVADALSTFDNLVSNIRVEANGSRVVKSVRPHMLRMHQLLAFQIEGERKSSAGATEVVDVTTDGGFAYGVTTDLTTVQETVTMYFECILARFGKESTWLNARGLGSLTLQLTTNAFSALLGFGNTAPVVYSASTFVYNIKTVEAQDVPANVNFADWKESAKTEPFSSETLQRLVDLNRGNKLMGVSFLARDGAPGSATTATGKLLSNKVLTDIELILNGQNSIKKTTFQDLRAQMIARGLNSPYSGGVSRTDGFAYLDLLQDGNLQTALDVAPPAVDNVQLALSTRAAADVDYTNPCDVLIHTHEIVKVIA